MWPVLTNQSGYLVHIRPLSTKLAVACVVREMATCDGCVL